MSSETDHADNPNNDMTVRHVYNFPWWLGGRQWWYVAWGMCMCMALPFPQTYLCEQCNNGSETPNGDSEKN